MISVIIPLYNKENEIAKAIGSVLNQSFSQFELLIVNDGSTDQSTLVAKTFTDQRIRFFDKINGGVSSARNLGIYEAKNDLIAFLDGDDWWHKDFLKTLFQLSQKYEDAGMWCGQYVQVNRKHELVSLNRFPVIYEGYFDLYKHLYAVCSSSILIKKDVFYVCGYFDENLTHGEDTDMWIRTAFNFKICYCNQIISYYNIGGNPITKSIGKIPPLSNHFLSKIDNYIGVSDDWDMVLIEKKILYLKNYLIQMPLNKSLMEMIKTLPTAELNKKDNIVFRQSSLILFFKHFILIFKQKLLFIRNWIMLKMKDKLNNMFF